MAIYEARFQNWRWSGSLDPRIRMTDADDWMVNPSLFMSVDMLWGPHTVDSFASAHNYQILVS